MSTFSGLHTGLSSLHAQRRGLELAGHNIANANTEGYSRQRLQLQADGGPLAPAMASRWAGVGNGVSAVGVQRLRDAFQESRSVQERGTQAGLRGDQVLLGRIETVLAEPSASGVQAQLADFWAGWDDVANQPDSPAARSQLLERAATLAAGLDGAAQALEQQWSASREQLSATLADINATAASVADLNRSIVAATRAGLTPHDLSDQRDLLVQRLAGLAGVTVRPGDSGSVDVHLGATALVRGEAVDRLTASGPDTMPQPGLSPVVPTPRGLVSVTSESTGQVVVGGSAGALVRGMNDVLPRHRDGLTAVAGALLEQVNAVHTAGFDRDGRPGGPFFAGVDGRLTVVVDGPGRVAASDVGDLGTPTPNRGGGNAARLAELATARGGPDELYRQSIVGLGVEAQTASRRTDIHAGILAQIDAARAAETGVDLDEEMTSLLAYQRAYEGAARFVTAVDQVLDTLINRTGTVGR